MDEGILVKVYFNSNNVLEYYVTGENALERAREHAKRIITEGFWDRTENGNEVFYPVHQIYKVKVII